MPHAVDFLRDSKLDAKFFGHDTLHVSYRSLASNQQRNTRVDERWTRKRKIGGGTYGQVWLESCSEGPKKGDLRAVKEISKAQATVADTDYTRELEAITKFSEAKVSLGRRRQLQIILVHMSDSRQYVHCFVQSFGWYESDDSIYIAMEYIEHGDLQKQLTRSFPDFEVQSIASQILQGLQFMHENGFTHRDLKPSVSSG
jgi:serine/threonine protein kinase